MAAQIPPQAVAALLREYVRADSGKSRSWLNRLKKLPASETISVLKEQLLEADNKQTFDRLARLAAELCNEIPADQPTLRDEIVAMLSEHMRRNRRFPRLAMRALAQCSHPQTVPLLIERLIHGYQKQRVAAAQHLARKQSAVAIEPLCQCAAFPESRIVREALEALRTMGRPDHLGRLLLAEAALSTQDRVRVLRALESLPLTFFRFNARRFLEREARSLASPLTQAAKACFDLMHAADTLLRPTERPGVDTLLRPAFGPGPGDPDALLRAAQEPEEDDDLDEPPARHAGWWGAVMRLFIRR